MFVLQEFEAVPVIYIIWNHSVIINSVYGWRTNTESAILLLLLSLSGKPYLVFSGLKCMSLIIFSNTGINSFEVLKISRNKNSGVDNVSCCLQSTLYYIGRFPQSHNSPVNFKKIIMILYCCQYIIYDTLISLLHLYNFSK